jgi:hypothetical protein
LSIAFVTNREHTSDLSRKHKAICQGVAFFDIDRVSHSVTIYEHTPLDIAERRSGLLKTRVAMPIAGNHAIFQQRYIEADPRCDGLSMHTSKYTGKKARLSSQNSTGFALWLWS